MAGDGPGQFGEIGPGVGVTGAVSAAKTLKCDVLPVTVPVLTLEPPSTGCQVDVVGSKKNTPAGGAQLKLSMTAAGGAKPWTGAPLEASVAVRLTTVLTTCCPLSAAGGVVRV